MIYFNAKKKNNVDRKRGLIKAARFVIGLIKFIAVIALTYVTCKIMGANQETTFSVTLLGPSLTLLNYYTKTLDDTLNYLDSNLDYQNCKQKKGRGKRSRKKRKTKAHIQKKHN